MARAAAPIFSPSCGSTSTMTGPGGALKALVLSVPAPGMQYSWAGKMPNAQPLPKPAACVKRGTISDDIRRPSPELGLMAPAALWSAGGNLALTDKALTNEVRML